MKNVLIENIDFTKRDLISYDKIGVLRFLSDYLYRNGIVHESFAQAVLERENQFPTGLNLAKGGVAIPHTDPEHVIDDKILVLRLNDAIEFNHMVAPDNKVNTNLIIMIVIKHREKQTQVLSSIMELMQNDNNMDVLLNKGKEQVVKLLNEYKLI